jgi:hypothetical protein
MMTEYILILAFLSPGGDFMGKHGIVQKDRATCHQSLVVVQNQVTPMGGKVRALCVTRAHWEGKAQDKGVAFD